MSDGEGPRCALHFDAPSNGICQRCGRFCCVSCLVEREPPLCATCAPTMVDPLDLHSRSFEFVSAFVIGFKLVAAELGALLALVLIFSLPSAALQVALVSDGDEFRSVRTSVQLSNFYELVIGIIGAQAMLALLIARGEGRALSLGGALNEAMQNWSRAVGARFRAGLHILGFLLLLVLPGFWKATLLMFTSISVLRSRRRDALEASESLVRGRFWLCFGFGLVALGVCYGPLIVVSWMLGVLAQELGGPRFVVELVNDALERFGGDVLLTAVLYAGYVMLHRSAGLELEPMRWIRVPPLAKR